MGKAGKRWHLGNRPRSYYADFLHVTPAALLLKKDAIISFRFLSGNAAWKFLGLAFVLLFDLQLSAFDISSANFSVATVNNKVMLFLLSVFPILLLLFALELKLFALAVLTQSFRSPKLHISTVCKIGQLLKCLLSHKMGSRKSLHSDSSAQDRLSHLKGFLTLPAYRTREVFPSS